MSRPLRGLGNLTAVSLLIVPLLLLLPAPSQGQLVVNQLEIFLDDAGGAASGTFSVSNASANPVTGQLLLQDWERREDGTNVFVEPGTVTGSCHPSVEVFPGFLLLAPGESQIVQVSYTGASRTTSCWTSVRVAPAPTPASDDSSVRLNVEVHQYVKVYVEPAGGWGDVEIVDADVVPFERDQRRGEEPESLYDILAIVTNPGTIQARVSGVVEYRTLDNTVVRRSAFADAPVLPGAVRRMRVALPNLAPGRYVALVLLDGGGADRAAAQIDLDISP